MRLMLLRFAAASKFQLPETTAFKGLNVSDSHLSTSFSQPMMTVTNISAETSSIIMTTTVFMVSSMNSI